VGASTPSYRSRCASGRGVSAASFSGKSTGSRRRCEKAAVTLPWRGTSADAYLVAPHLPGQALNTAEVNDPKLTEMIRLQRCT
jgi:hypothetical protein